MSLEVFSRQSLWTSQSPCLRLDVACGIVVLLWGLLWNTALNRLRFWIHILLAPRAHTGHFLGSLTWNCLLWIWYILKIWRSLFKNVWGLHRRHPKSSPKVIEMHLTISWMAFHFSYWCLEYDFWLHTLPRSCGAKSETWKIPLLVGRGNPNINNKRQTASSKRQRTQRLQASVPCI